ncbi:MAG: hypothetical protein IPJ00_11320 [Saprospirales bacterium]|nr:hypothetical protein [Saprospirales bacterium]
MGIIIRQSVRQSIVQYIGIGIGLFSTLFIYPLALSETGLMRFVINTAQLVTPFCLLGTHVLAVRFFPVFKDEKTRHHGLLGLLHGVALAGVAVFSLLYFTYGNQFEGLFADQPAEYLPFLTYTVPLVFFMVFSYLYSAYASNFHKVVYPAIFHELLPKIGLPVLVLLFFLQWIGLDGMMNGVLAVFAAVFLAQLLYLMSLREFSLRQPDKGFITRPLRKELFQFGSVNILSNWAYMLSNRIDLFMLGLMLGPEAFKGVGIYAILYLMSEVIDTPRKAVMNISSPIIAKAWKENDLGELKELYEKSSLNQFLAGWLLFLGIWAALDGLFVLMPNGEEIAPYAWVVFFLGISKVSEMLTGVNSLIIQHEHPDRPAHGPPGPGAGLPHPPRLFQPLGRTRPVDRPLCGDRGGVPGHRALFSGIGGFEWGCGGDLEEGEGGGPLITTDFMIAQISSGVFLKNLRNHKICGNLWSGPFFLTISTHN